MTTKKGIVLLFMITMIAFMILPVQGAWEVEQIESIYDDGFIAETGGSFFETPWVQIQGGSVNIASYFAFRGVTIPDNSTILNAYLEFTAPFPWNYNQTLLGTVYGIKTPDLTSWDPTPSLLSEPITTSLTDFDLAPLISGASINVTVTDQVTEIYELYSWESNNDMGFSVLTVAVSGGARYQVAYDNDPALSLSLYVEYTESTNTTFYYKGYEITEVSGNLTQTATVSDITSGDKKLYQWDSATKTEDFDQTNVTFVHGFNSNFDTIKVVGSNAYILSNPELDITRIQWLETPDNGDTFTANLTILDSASTQEYYSQDYHNGTFHIAYTTIGGEVYYNNVTQLSNGSWVAYYPGLGLEIASHASVVAPQVVINPANNTIYVAYSRGTTANVIKTQLPVMFGDGFWDVATNNLVTGTRSEVRVASNGTVYWLIWDAGADIIRVYNVGAGGSWTDIPWSIKASDNTVETYSGSAIGNISTTEFIVIGSTDLVGGIQYPQAHTFNLGTNAITEYQGNVTAPTQSSFCIPYTLSNGIVRLIINRATLGVYEVPANWLGFKTQLQWQQYVIKGTTHTLAMTGRDPNLGSGVGDGYIVTLNGTFIGEFETIEDAKAAIDDIEGQTPDDPNPPGTTYPEDGFGELTRFNLRMYIWLIGWVLIFIPPLAMAYKSYPFQFYLIFFIIEVFGWALLWSIASI